MESHLAINTHTQRQFCALKLIISYCKKNFNVAGENTRINPVKKML